MDKIANSFLLVEKFGLQLMNMIIRSFVIGYSAWLSMYTAELTKIPLL